MNSISPVQVYSFFNSNPIILNSRSFRTSISMVAQSIFSSINVSSALTQCRTFTKAWVNSPLGLLTTVVALGILLHSYEEKLLKFCVRHGFLLGIICLQELLCTKLQDYPQLLEIAEEHGQQELVNFLVSIEGFERTAAYPSQTSDASISSANPTNDSVDSLEHLSTHFTITEATLTNALTVAINTSNIPALEFINTVTNYPLQTVLCQGDIYPAHVAIQNDSIDLLRWLAEHALTSLNRCNAENLTPLMLASQSGKTACVRELISHQEVDLHAQNEDGLEAIHLATQSGHLETLKVLVNEAHISLNQLDADNSPPILFAAASEGYEIVEWISQQDGVNLAAIDSIEYNILDYAIFNTNRPLVEWILNHTTLYNNESIAHYTTTASDTTLDATTQLMSGESPDNTHMNAAIEIQNLLLRRATSLRALSAN